MRVVVEVGGWEHECCGPAYERDAIVTITCLVIPGPDHPTARYVESHHGRTTVHPMVELRGRVDDLRIEHRNGSTETIDRLPSGPALSGFDDQDDGHLEQPWTGQLVTRDADRYLLTVLT